MLHRIGARRERCGLSVRTAMDLKGSPPFEVQRRPVLPGTRWVFFSPMYRKFTSVRSPARRRHAPGTNSPPARREKGGAMRCETCNRPLQFRRKDYPYTESGLGNVVIAGAPVYTCPLHGVQALAVAGVHALHAQIARAILGQRSLLSGPEIRFLRKYRGWNQGDLAHVLGVTRVSVSNWERGASPVGK